MTCAGVLFAAFGPVRIMYGSDWPVYLLNADYDRVIDAAGTALRIAVAA